MTVTLEASLEATPAPSPHPATPHLRDVVRRVLISLLTAVVAPCVLFTTSLVLVGIAFAMVAALAWMLAALAWRHATGRTVSGLLVLTFAIMTVKTGIALATGSTFVYFLQPVVVDATVATLFLGSLWTGRPLAARLAPDFYPMAPEVAARPRIQRLFRRLTLMWGLVIVAKGSITLWLLLSMSTVHFVVVKNSVILSVTVATAATTVLWSCLVGRREGLFVPAPALAHAVVEA